MAFHHNPIITDAYWLGPSALRVEFTSNWSTMLHQLYVGRRKLAETVSLTQRVLECQLVPSRWPQFLTVVAVSGDEAGVDNGSWLPPGPYNVVKTSFGNPTATGNSWEDDVLAFDLFRGAEPGGAIDYSTIIRTKLHTTASSPTYVLYSDPLPGSGEWNLAVRGRDGDPETGNTGTADEFTATVTAIPPDFDDDFSVAVATNTLTVTCTLPER